MAKFYKNLSVEELSLVVFTIDDIWEWNIVIILDLKPWKYDCCLHELLPFEGYIFFSLPIKWCPTFETNQNLIFHKTLTDKQSIYDYGMQDGRFIYFIKLINALYLVKKWFIFYLLRQK